MSVRAITWAWDQETATASHKLVLLALADHAGEDFTCYPSTGRLAEKTGLHQRTIRKYLDALVEARFVEKLERRRRGDGTLSVWTYRIAPGHPQSTSDTGGSLDDQLPPVTAPVTPGDRTSGPLGARGTVNEPSKNHPPTPEVITDAPPGGGAEEGEHRDEPTPASPLSASQLALHAAKMKVRQMIQDGREVRSQAGLERSISEQIIEQHQDRLDWAVDLHHRATASSVPVTTSQLAGYILTGECRSLAAVISEVDHADRVESSDRLTVDQIGNYLPARYRTAS